MHLYPERRQHGAERGNIGMRVYIAVVVRGAGISAAHCLRTTCCAHTYSPPTPCHIMMITIGSGTTTTVTGAGGAAVISTYTCCQ